MKFSLRRRQQNNSKQVTIRIKRLGILGRFREYNNLSLLLLFFKVRENNLEYFPPVK